MRLKRKVLIAAIGAVPVLGAGGAAWSSTMSSAGAQVTPSPSGQTTTSDPAVENGPPGTNDAAEPSAAGEAPEMSNEVPGAPENDGPGGHVDPPGAEIDHQFNGQE